MVELLNMADAGTLPLASLTPRNFPFSKTAYALAVAIHPSDTPL